MISFVIPVYRSAGSLPELVLRITQQFGTRTDGFEIIFVEDCGGDNSWQTIELLAKSDQRIRGLRLTRNYGQHNALLCGIRAAQGEVIVTLDDDLQHPPEEIPKLLSKLDEGHDVVYGSPEHEPHGLMRGLASQGFKLALRSTMGAENAQQVSALRVFKTRLRNAFTNYADPIVNIDVLLTWGTTRFSAIKVRHDVRTLGKSGYTPRKLVRHAVNMMTGFSVRPLKLASMIGFTFSILGLAILVYVLTLWLLRGSAVPGFVFLVSIIAIFSGAQLLALGIIGEYLARMHMRAQERPAYIVCEELNTKSDRIL